MSLLLIDQANLYPFNAKSCPSSHIQSSILQAKIFESPSTKSNKQSQTNSDSSQNILNEQDQRLLLPFFKGYELLLILEGNSRVLLRIITPSGQFLRVRNTRSMPQFCLRAAQMNVFLNRAILTFSAKSTTGELAFHLPLYIATSRDDAMRFNGLLEGMWKTHMQSSLPLLEYILAEGLQQGATTYRNVSKFRTLNNIFRYMEMLNISSHLNETRLETELNANQKERKRREDIKRVRQRKVVTPEWVGRTSSIFEFRQSYASLVPAEEKDFELQHEESRFVRWMLSMPVQAKPKNPYQNLMILNHIQIQDIDNLKLRPINAGGFSTIFLTEVRYLYVYSSEDHEQMHIQQEVDPLADREKKMLRKFMVAKKELGQGPARNAREIQVLRRIKNGSSIFMPKYYIVTNRDNPHSDCLFMDFIPSRNLKEYLYVNSTSVSLITKLYLAFSILQALRYIRDYQIVHLDLKPNNIMIYCNMLVKLIDFGEAYHPSLHSHKPGYTIPYSSPELYTRGGKFTTKSDVFSFGVLLFEMLFSLYPYDIFKPTRQIPYIMQRHHQQWYLAPEQSITFGQGQVMRILMNLISRCMASRPEHRPELDWVALVIKQCFEVLQ